MGRYIFTPTGVVNFKKTVHETVSLLDNWYWVNRATSLFSQNNNNRLDESGINQFWEDESNHIRFKPKHMALINKISVLFGYKNYRELESVSSSEPGSPQLNLENASELLNAIVSVFVAEINDALSLPSKSLSVLSVMAHLAVSSWQLNKPAKPIAKKLRVQIDPLVQMGQYNLEIVRKGNIWEFRLFLKHNGFEGEPFIIASEQDETSTGSLLPAAGIFLLEDPKSIVNKSESMAIKSKHIDFSKSLSKDRYGILAVIGYDKLYESTRPLSKLSHYHAISESLSGVTIEELRPLIDESDSIQSFRLLAYLDNLEFTHHRKEDNARWFTKPHDLSTRKDFLNQTIGVFNKKSASTIEYVDDQFIFTKNK